MVIRLMEKKEERIKGGKEDGERVMVRDGVWRKGGFRKGSPFQGGVSGVRGQAFVEKLNEGL